MVKALTFKGEKKSKKRKHTEPDDENTGLTALSNALTKSETATGDDDSWVTARSPEEIVGPVIIILSAKPASCLATDANGKIFASTLENMIDDDPGTAEPHDVRQVWVSNRVAGSETFNFKGYHGRYLGCDKIGLLSAVKEAVSPEESFQVVPITDEPATFGVQSRDKYIAAKSTDAGAPVSLRGDAEDVGLQSTMRFRVQARFVPRLRVSREEKIREKISKSELEEAVGRRLEDEEVKKLKKARREGNYHEAILDVKVKGKHDKFA